MTSQYDFFFKETGASLQQDRLWNVMRQNHYKMAVYTLIYKNGVGISFLGTQRFRWLGAGYCAQELIGNGLLPEERITR